MKNKITFAFIILAVLCGSSLAAPVITGIAPYFLVRNGAIDQTIFISGTTFDPNAAVTLEGTGIRVITVAYDAATGRLGALVNISDTAEAGSRKITVVNPDATTGSAEKLFYVATATSEDLTAVAPNYCVTGTLTRDVAIERSLKRFGQNPEVLIVYKATTVNAHPEKDRMINPLLSSFYSRRVTAMIFAVDLSVPSAADTGTYDIAVFNDEDGTIVTAPASLSDADITVNSPPSSGSKVIVNGVFRDGVWSGLAANILQIDLPCDVRNLDLYAASPDGDLALKLVFGPMMRGMQNITIPAVSSWNRAVGMGIIPFIGRGDGTGGENVQIKAKVALYAN